MTNGGTGDVIIAVNENISVSLRMLLNNQRA